MAFLLKAFFHQMTFYKLFRPTFTCQYQSRKKLIQVKYSKMVQNQPKQHFSHLAKAECSAMSKKVITNLSCQTQRPNHKIWLRSNVSAKFLGQILWPDALARCFGPNPSDQMLWPNSLAKYFGKMFHQDASGFGRSLPMTAYHYPTLS